VHIIEPSALQAECTTLHVSCAVHPVAPSPQHSTSAAQSCAQMASSSAASVTVYVSCAHLAHAQALSRLMHAPSAYVASAAGAVTSADWPQSRDARATFVDAGNSRNVVGAQQVLAPLSARTISTFHAAMDCSLPHLDVTAPSMQPAHMDRIQAATTLAARHTVSDGLHSTLAAQHIVPHALYSTPVAQHIVYDAPRLTHASLHVVAIASQHTASAAQHTASVAMHAVHGGHHNMHAPKHVLDTIMSDGPLQVPVFQYTRSGVSTAAMDCGTRYLDTTRTTSVVPLTPTYREVLQAACTSSLHAQYTMIAPLPLAQPEHSVATADPLVHTVAPTSAAACPAFVPSPSPPAVPPDRLSMHVVDHSSAWAWCDHS